MSASAPQSEWAFNQERARGRHPLKHKIDGKQRTQIAARANAGESPTKLALEFEISAKYVRELRRRFKPNGEQNAG